MKIISALLLLLISVWPVCACRSTTRQAALSPPQDATAAVQQSRPGIHADTGFRTKRNLDEHYEKHGGEFGAVSKAEYLRLAQSLRDRPAGGDVLEAKRADGVTTRFDRHSGAFLAFNEDLTIRTLFKPNDGEAYFRRQLKRSH